MKKTMILSLALVSSLFSMSEKELNEYKKIDGLNQPSVKLIAGKKISGDLALIKGYQEFPGNRYSPIDIVTDKKILIPTGKVRDLISKKSIFLDIDYSKFEKSAAYKFGKGKEKLILFTEAECPACKQAHPFIEQLKDDYTIYVYMYPLNGIHLAATDIAIATLSQAPEKREAFYNKYLKAKDLSLFLPELEKYGVQLYRNIKKGIDSLGQREFSLAQRYVRLIEKAYKTKFTTKSEIIAFCDKKIKTFEETRAKTATYKNALKAFEESQFLGNAYLGVSGTPNIFNYHGEEENLRLLLSKKRR